MATTKQSKQHPAAGAFGVESAFLQVKGIESGQVDTRAVVSLKNPTYEQVCTGDNTALKSHNSPMILNRSLTAKS